MEVTRSTFHKLFPIIEEAIRTASFISIDMEFTGLQSSKNKSYSIVDTIQQRYEKLKDSANTFSVLQFGLTTFTWLPADKKYNVKPFWFYLYSDPSKVFGYDRRLSFQTSSASFLSQYKFDFNKVFHEGIPYMNTQEEDMFRKRKTFNIIIKERDDFIEETDSFIEKQLKCIEKWFQCEDQEDFTLPSCSRFNRYLLFQHIKFKYGSTLQFVRHVDENGNAMILLKRLFFSNDEHDKVDRDDHDDDEFFEMNLQEQIGFRKVIDVLIHYKKPIILHNSVLDICHLYAKFIGRLPDSVIEFKSSLSQLFPMVYDTKLLSSHPNIRSLFPKNSLQDLYVRLQGVPFKGTKSIVIFEEGYKTYEGSSLNLTFHDAGYDSFCTGLVFLQLINYLNNGTDDNLEVDFPSDVDLELFEGHFKLRNKLNLMKSDYECLDLLQPEKIPDRSNMFYVYGFSKSWKTCDIENVFSSYGKFQIIWIDAASVFIVFEEKGDQFDEFVRHVETIKENDASSGVSCSDYHVMSYASYINVNINVNVDTDVVNKRQRV